MARRETVHHRLELARVEPVTRIPRLPGEQYQHRKLRPGRGQVSGRQVDIARPGREPRPDPGNVHLVDGTGLRHSGRRMPDTVQCLPWPGDDLRDPHRLGEQRLRVQPGRQGYPQRRIRLEGDIDLVSGRDQHEDAGGDRGGPPRPGPEQRLPGERQHHAGQGHPRPEHDGERQQVGKRPPDIVGQPRQQGDDPAGGDRDDRYADRQPAHRHRPAGTSPTCAAPQRICAPARCARLPARPLRAAR